MKTLLILCILSFAGISLAWEPQHPRGYNNIGSVDCQVGTYAYATGNDCGYVRPEATCENPTPELDTNAKICNYLDCYCDPPTVRNTVTQECVPLDECPK